MEAMKTPELFVGKRGSLCFSLFHGFWNPHFEDVEIVKIYPGGVVLVKSLSTHRMWVRNHEAIQWYLEQPKRPGTQLTLL